MLDQQVIYIYIYKKPINASDVHFLVSRAQARGFFNVNLAPLIRATTNSQVRLFVILHAQLDTTRMQRRDPVKSVLFVNHVPRP